jgi:hypothetical protein
MNVCSGTRTNVAPTSNMANEARTLLSRIAGDLVQLAFTVNGPHQREFADAVG